jgi:hypothetical protein
MVEEVDTPVFEKDSRSSRIAKNNAARVRRLERKTLAKIREDKEIKDEQERFKAKKLMNKQRRKAFKKRLHQPSNML